MTLNFKKCQFGKTELTFLGHIISAGGIRPDPDKVKAVQEFQPPNSVSDLRSFLGLANQMRRFIPKYADLTKKMNDLLRTDRLEQWKKKTAWKDIHQEEFEKLKSVITSDSVLAHPDFSKPFLLVCDASNTGCGAMLAQASEQGPERPIAFASKTLNPAQRNYTATQKEGLAVVWAIDHFKSYIHGVPTVVETDHSALTWYLKEPNSRMARWVMAIMEYDITFVHRKGAENRIADALSRLTRTQRRE
jgi:hypothetical protein